MAGRAELRLGYSEETNKIIKTPQTADTSYISKKPGEVEAKAKSEVTRLGGNPSNETDLLGQFKLQFGRFKDKTFKWLLENGLGYVAWIVNSMLSETATSSPLSVNKHSFAEYFKSFPEGREALAFKKEKAKEQTALSTSTSSSTTRQTSTRTSNTTAVALLVGRSSLSPQETAKRLHQTIQDKVIALLLCYSDRKHQQAIIINTFLIRHLPNPAPPSLSFQLNISLFSDFFPKELNQKKGSERLVERQLRNVTVYRI